MMKKIGLLLLLSFGLVGCTTHWFGPNGTIHNRTDDYQHSQEALPLMLPPGYSSAKITQYYPVPYHKNLKPTKYKVDITPPGLH